MIRVSAILLLLSMIHLSHAQGEMYYPPIVGSEWSTLDSETLGWCPDRIEELYAYLEEIDSRSFILLKDGKIVLEQYFAGATMESDYTWFSAGKSLRAVLIGMAQQENLLDIHDKTSDYIGSGWTSLSPAQEDSITIWHQLTMTSGLDDTNFFCVNPSCLNYVATPGTRWAYHNGPYNLTKAVLEEATGVDHNIYTDRLEERIGMTGFWYPLLGNSFYQSTARDMARFGLLMLNRGAWANDTILTDSQYVDAMLSPSQSLNPAYGYLWWLNGQEYLLDIGSTDPLDGWMSPNAPEYLYTAAGSGGQLISISPADNLVMVRQSAGADIVGNGDNIIDGIWQKIGQLYCVSKSEDLESVDVRIYPNPVSDRLLIDIGSTTTLDISIYDVFNKCVHSTAVNGKSSVDISHLNSGMYFLHIGDTDRVVKFVKE